MEIVRIVLIIRSIRASKKEVGIFILLLPIGIYTESGTEYIESNTVAAENNTDATDANTDGSLLSMHFCRRFRKRRR